MIRGSLPIVFCQEWLLHRVFWTAAAGMGSGWASYFKAELRQLLLEKICIKHCTAIIRLLESTYYGVTRFPQKSEIPQCHNFMSSGLQKDQIFKKIENLDFLCNPLKLWNKKKLCNEDISDFWKKRVTLTYYWPIAHFGLFCPILHTLQATLILVQR